MLLKTFYLVRDTTDLSRAIAKKIDLDIKTNQMPMSKCQTRRFTTNPYPPYVILSQAVVFTGPSYGVISYLRVRVIMFECSGFEPDLYISTTRCESLSP